MKKQLASGGADNEKQKAQVNKIIGYCRVLVICGTIGVLFRFSR